MRGNETAEENSVFDFLYFDASRVSSFISQFDNYGPVLSSVKAESIAEQNGDNQEYLLEGGIPTVAKANSKFNTNFNKSKTNTKSSTHDGAWFNALNFMDYVQEKKLLNGNVGEAGIGQFVLASGNIKITDLNLMKKILSSSMLKKSLLSGVDGDQESGNRKLRRAQGSTPKAQPTSAELGMELMDFMPFSLHMTMVNQAYNIWSNLREECLMVGVSDLLLKHGSNLPGVWFVIGLLDAKAFDGSGSTVNVSTGNQLVDAIDAFTPIVRNLLGRPEGCYGITPLMIFRQVS